MRRTPTAVFVAAAIAVCFAIPVCAEPSVWRAGRSAHCTFEIRAAADIARNRKLSWILDEGRRRIERELREQEDFAQSEIAKAKAGGEARAFGNCGYYETIYLLGQTARYAAILISSASMAIGAASGGSYEEVVIYRLSDRLKFAGSAALALDTQADVLRRLAIRDADVDLEWIGELMETGSRADDSDSVSVAIALHVDRDDAPGPYPQRTLQFIKQDVRTGFSTDEAGRVKSIDLYFSRHRFGGHFRAYRWSIDAADAASLLAPELRDLIGAPGAR